MYRPLLAAALAILPAQALPAQDAAAPAADPFAGIEWQIGPAKGQIGGESTIDVPKECRFTGASGARTFMLATENPPSGEELGILLCGVEEEEPQESPWFVVFSFDASGYVKDDDAKDLDADAILESYRQGTEQSNKERTARGWAPLTITGWARAPFYDPASNNLTWAMKATSEGDEVVNHSVRLLGRGGVMNADLVVDPTQLATATAQFDRIIGTHAFVAGRKYSEWVPGDKVAEYGLTALAAGGAVAVAAKTGLLSKLFKFLWVGVLALAAGLRSLFSRKSRQDPPSR